MNWFKRRSYEPEPEKLTQVHKEIADERPSMHILCLDMTNKELFGVGRE